MTTVITQTAAFVRDLSADFQGEAALYHLDPPYADEVEYVIASAVDLPVFIPDYRTSETMVFPAAADGSVSDWGEIGFASHKSHADALADMGYTLV